MIKEVDNKMIVDVPIMEIYLPAEYKDRGLYYMKGPLVEFYGVCNMKTFNKEEDLEHREAVKTIPIGIALMITSNPSEIDIGEVKFSPSSPLRKCVILRYYKNDELMTNTSCIIASDNVGNLLTLLENGKLDYIPVKYIRDIVDRAEIINKTNLRLSLEAKDAMIIECYRDPHNINKSLRHSKNSNEDLISSPTSREESMLSSTYQAFTFEDINSSLLAAVNRAKAGVEEEPTVMERIIRGDTVTPTA